MPLILAIEPDRGQASQLAALVRIRLDAELLVADSIKRAVSMLGARLPDLILTSPNLTPSDKAALVACLRQFDAAAAHVQVLTIPTLARPAGSSNTALPRHRRIGAKSPCCDPSIFAARISDQLERSAAEGALHRAAAESRGAAPVQAAAVVAEPIEEIPEPVDPEDEEEEDDEVAGAAEVIEAVAPPDAVVAAATRDEDPRELWSALSADDSRAWPPIEGIHIRTPQPQHVVPLDRVEVWTALSSAVHAWPLIEGVPADEAVRAQPTAAAERDDLVRLVAELRREIKALRMLHAEPLAPPAAIEPTLRQDEWDAYDPNQYGMPALIARLDTPADLPDDPPASDRPS